MNLLLYAQIGQEVINKYKILSDDNSNGPRYFTGFLKICFYKFYFFILYYCKKITYKNNIFLKSREIPSPKFNISISSNN
jgi:hypothetical protein